MSGNVLEMRDVWFGYPGVSPLFQGQSLEVPEGGHIKCVLGPSGVGKSTMLQLAMGQLSAQAGNIDIKGAVLPVFQDFESMVLPWFSIRRNISWGLNGAVQDDLQDVVRLLEIESILDFLPGHVSGGQRQRMVLARALVRRPGLLLLDEPLANLDAGTSKRILPRLRSYLVDGRISVLWVTHNIGEALSVADAVCVLHAGGTLHEFGVATRGGDDTLANQIQGLLR